MPSLPDKGHRLAPSFYSTCFPVLQYFPTYIIIRNYFVFFVSFIDISTMLMLSLYFIKLKLNIYNMKTINIKFAVKKILHTFMFTMQMKYGILYQVLHVLSSYPFPAHGICCKLPT
jgi:hypothetical protein